MKTPMSKLLRHSALGILTLVFLSSCQQSPDLTGKWQEIENKAILEFHEDNGFTATDNMGMTVSGTYDLDNDGNMRFEIKHNDSPPEIISAKISLQGDELTIIYGDGAEIEKYKIIKP